MLFFFSTLKSPNITPLLVKRQKYTPQPRNCNRLYSVPPFNLLTLMTQNCNSLWAIGGENSFLNYISWNSSGGKYSHSLFFDIVTPSCCEALSKASCTHYLSYCFDSNLLMKTSIKIPVTFCGGCFKLVSTSYWLDIL